MTIPVTGFSSGVSRAYQAAQSMPAQPAQREEPAGASFSEMLEQTAQDALHSVRAGDEAAIAGLQGKMSTQDVVEATMAMESALKVTTAVRDRVVEAYQEVLRMAV